MAKKGKYFYDIVILLSLATIIIILFGFDLQEMVTKYIMVFIGVAYYLGKYAQYNEK